MNLSEQLTYSTVLINVKYDNGISGSGTGFIIDFGQNSENFMPVLITNNHVVENTIETSFEFCKADDNGNPIDTESFLVKVCSNNWIKHPDKDIDLCCLILTEILAQLEKDKIEIFFAPIGKELIPSEDVLKKLSAIEDVIMIGYPIGISDTYNHKPIVRKGITASHPNKKYNGNRETLLDIGSYSGSSGSPVFIFNEGSYSTEEGIFLSSRVYLLGILYGGYIYSANGFLNFEYIPTKISIKKFFVNLGGMIKSEAILDFEKIIIDMEKDSNGKNEDGKS